MPVEPSGRSVRRSAGDRLLPLVASVGGALIVVNASSPSLGIALPQLAADVGATQAETTWISSVSAVVSAAALLPLGRAADRWGRRRFLTVGLLLFGVVEVATASVSRPEVLIALRALSGLATAVVLPVSLAVLVAAFPREQRARAVAVWATTVSVSASIAGLASGQLTTAVSWRVMPIVLGLLALALVLPLRRAVPETRTTTARPDTVGGLLVLIGMGALVLGIGQAGQGALADPAVLVPALLGLLVLAGFVAWEWRAPAPMLPVRLFAASRTLQVGMVVLVLTTGSFAAYTFIGVQYLQNVRDLTPWQSALTFLLTEAGVVSSAVCVPWLVRRAGVRILGSVGAGVVAVAFLLLAVAAGLPWFWPFAVALVLLGVGFALSSTPASTLVVSGLPSDRLGVASAVNNVGRDIGSSVGTAVVGAVLLAVYQSRVSATVATLPPPTAEQVDSGITNALEAARGIGPAAGAVIGPAREAFIGGFQTGALAAAALAVVAALACGVFAPSGLRKARDIDPELDSTPVTAPTDSTPSPHPTRSSS